MFSASFKTDLMDHKSFSYMLSSKIVYKVFLDSILFFDTSLNKNVGNAYFQQSRMD